VNALLSSPALPREMAAPRAMISLASIRPLVQIMLDSGLDPGSVLVGAGLPEGLFEQESAQVVELAAYFRICEQMALLGEDESCHVSLRPLIAGTSRLVQHRLLGCKTMAQVLDVLAESYNIIHGGQYNRVVKRGRTTSYLIDDTRFPYALGHDEPFVIFSLECLLVYVHALILSLAADPGGMTLRQMRTRGDGTGQDRLHLACWGVPVLRRSPLFAIDYTGDAASIAVDPMRSPVITSRTIYGGVADMLDRLAPQPSRCDLAVRVSRAIDQGLHDQSRVARQLGLSVASLRRGLTTEGTSFRALRAERLEEAAKAALGTGMTISDTAELLGFSDSRSFARAFHRWTGRTPGSLRRQER
jgi:AraC-like DNA-binding protein